MPSYFEQLQNHARQRPGAIAIHHDRGRAEAARTTTWAELAERAQAFASIFANVQAKAPIVPMLMDRSANCITAMMGALAASRAFCCLNKKLRAPQLAKIFDVLKPQAALVDPGGLALLSDVCNVEAVAGSTWWLIAEAPLSPAQETSLQRLAGTLRIEQWSSGSSNPVPSPASDASAPGACLFTSGSTGTPKGVLISAADLQDRAQAEADWFGLTRDDVLLNILPFSFDVGLNQLLSAIVSGCGLAILDSWLPPDILRAAATYKVTGISAVPAIWQDMLAAGMKFDTDQAHKSLRYITVSGGDLPTAQLDQLPQIAGSAGIFKTYGQSEAFRATSLRPEEFADRKRSVGRPFTSVRVYVVREDLTSCAPLEPGQIIHSGLGLMLGYADGRDSEDKLRPNPFFGPADSSRMCVFTGDMGYFDEAGYLYVNGRGDGMLKIAGNRVYPREIVEQLLKIENIEQAEVIGTATVMGATRLLALVVPAKGAQLVPAQLKRSAARLLPSFMLPHDFIVLPEMPRTASGKVDRPALVELAAQSS